MVKKVIFSHIHKNMNLHIMFKNLTGSPEYPYIFRREKFKEGVRRHFRVIIRPQGGYRVARRASNPLPARFPNRTCTRCRKNPSGTFRERFGFVLSRRRLSIDRCTRKSDYDNAAPRAETSRDPRPNSTEKYSLRSLDCCPVQIYNQPANRFPLARLTNRQLRVKLYPISWRFL